MIKRIALITATVATLGVLTATPAVAAYVDHKDPVDVPEPTTMLGLLVVGGSLVTKKVVDGRKTSR